MTITRRALLVLGSSLWAAPALAHHGWRWTSDGEFEISGRVVEARLGNPHGVLTLDAAGETWLIEVGQPWRNQRAGLSDDMLAPGAEIVARGHRSADPAQRVVKAERIVVGGATFDLYPDRS
jgi:hypothetical protein